MQLSNKSNLVLYLDKDLIRESKDLGFNLSRTFENHLKQLITQFSQLKTENNFDSKCVIIGKWAEPELNRRPLARKGTVLSFKNQEEMLAKFRDFQLVDLRRSKRTAYEKVWWIKRVLKFLNKDPDQISRDDLRLFLKSLDGYSRSHYKNALMALKVFFRVFLQKPDLVSSFKFPHRVFKPKRIVTKEKIRTFYDALETSKEKALFLLYATSGLRRQEILALTFDDVDFEKRRITPSDHLGETKKSRVSFYNEEAEQMLKQYLTEKKKSRSNRLFPMQSHEAVTKNYTKKTGRIMFPTSHDIIDEPEVEEACLTVLFNLLENGNEVLITTKPKLGIVQRINSELSQYKDRIQFRFTITSVDDELLRFWEPNAPSFSERMSSLKYAYSREYKTSVSIEPFLDYDPEVLVRYVEPYCTESIWVGKMNYIQKNNLTLFEKGYYEQVRRNYDHAHMKEVFWKLKEIPKIRFKDSFGFILAQNI